MKRSEFIGLVVALIVPAVLIFSTLHYEMAPAGVVPTSIVAHATLTPVPRPTRTPIPTLTRRPPQPTRIVPAGDPVTWKQLTVFLAEDHTNWEEWTSSHTCLDFACDLWRNAQAAGMYAYVVGVTFVDEEEGHAFVAFVTTDKGVVWIEPQDDYAWAPFGCGNQRICPGQRLCRIVDRSICMPGTATRPELIPLEACTQ